MSLFAAVLGCNNDPSPYYVVAEVRTPVLQLLQKASDTNTDPARKDCLTLDTGSSSAEGNSGTTEIWCQQYPVRPDAALLLKFVVMSPPGPDLTVSFDRLSRLAGLSSQLNSGGVARIGSSDNSNALPEDLTAYEISEVSALRKTVLEEPLKVQEYYYSIKLPSAETLFSDFQTKGALPAYSLQYSVKAAATVNHRSDQGFVSFYVFPDPQSRVFQALLDGLLNRPAATDSADQPPALSQDDIDRLKKQATSNTPPEILSFTPNGGTLPAKAETRLEILLGPDNDDDARSRVLWFVNSGKLSNNKSKRPNWKPESSGKGAAFVMVRDLQGGSDYEIKTFDVE